MGWVKQVPRAHKCKMPTRYADKQSFGSVWQCDDCGRLWKFRGFIGVDEDWKHCRLLTWWNRRGVLW